MVFKRFVIILILNITTAAFLFGNTSNSISFYKDSLAEQSSLFLFTAGYRMPLNKNLILNSGHGIYIEGGLNPGRYISKDLVLGFYAGFGLQDKCWATSFNQKFSNDFAASINKNQKFSGLDSTIIYSSSDLLKKTKGNSITLPGCEMRSFHNYSIYYGLILRLPFKYIPIFKAYMGTTRSYYLGDGNIATKQQSFNIFELRRAMYGCEVVVFRGTQNVFKNQKPSSKKNIGALSIYYESCNFYNSCIYFSDDKNSIKIPLKRFVSNSFLNKYKNEVSWGFKLSFYIM